MAPADACALIESKVHESLTNRRNWPKPYKVSPAEIRVDLHTPDQSLPYRGRVGVEILDARTIVSRADNFWTAWDQLWKH
jgi:hypothetical protein